MTAVVFKTPGLIDLRAFTVPGMSAKPNSTNPIGMFGTGLKYSVATILRLKGSMVVYIGFDRYEFQMRPEDFRGVSFDRIRMKVNKFSLLRSSYTDLPYTTTYGRNWAPWMVVRELEANTRDEGGTSFKTDSPHVAEAGHTCIVVELDAFIEAYDELSEIFLPDAQREGSGVQVVDEQSDYLYWRGLRVYKPGKRTLFTYNFLDYLTLTEDRTLAYEFQARAMLADQVAQSDDESFIEMILEAEEDDWEHELEFDTSLKPSEAFHRVARRSKKLSGSARGYYGHYDDRIRISTSDAMAGPPDALEGRRRRGTGRKRDDGL